MSKENTPPPFPEEKVCSVCKKAIAYKRRNGGVENYEHLGEALWSRMYWEADGHEECRRLEEEQRAQKERDEHVSKRVSELRQELRMVSRSLPEDYQEKTFENYTCAPENLKPLKYLRAWDPGKDTFGFFLMGTAGTGKTHLMQSLFNILSKKEREICENDKINPTNAALWANFSEFMEECRKEMFDKHRESPTMKKATNCRFLFLDDVATGAITDHQRNQFYLVLENRKNKGLPTFMTANLTGEEMKSSFHERVLSRIKENCVVFTIQGADFREGVMQANKVILEQRMNESSGG